MARAFCFIRDQPVYRRDAFLRGLRAARLTPTEWTQAQPESGDVMVVWNRYAELHERALKFERLGGIVLVAENGYLGNDRENRTRYAIARDGHNGSGWWPLGGVERWAELGIELQPWRRDGDHVLVCPNRSFGMPGFIMPPTWLETTVARIRRVTKRPIRVRPHPGNGPPKVPLAADLERAWACVIWSSSSGCEALVRGIPVFKCAPWWIAEAATSGALESIDDPALPERLPSMQRLAWAQWHVSEIERGLPFQHLLHGASAFRGNV